jgi:hypothetical protein
MSNRVVVEGTGVEITGLRMRESVVLRIIKRGHEVLRVHVAGAMEEMHDWEVERLRETTSDVIVAIGGTRQHATGGNTLYCSFAEKASTKSRSLSLGQRCSSAMNAVISWLTSLGHRKAGGMLRKRKEPKAKKSIAETLLRDMQGTAAQKLALFEKLKARGGFDGEDRRELLTVERMLRTFAATEKESG